MKFGVCIPNYGDTASVDGMRLVAVEAEKLGYDSIWTTDHVLLPKQSGTPYEQIFESISCLAYLAPLTRAVRLGISSLILAMRNPVVAVKQLATIDQLSRGRLLLAVAAGWSEAEFNHLGSNFHDRGRRLDESIKLIQTLWKDSEPRFFGKRIGIKFNDIRFEPRPVQEDLTIWIGGNSIAGMRRASTFGDAWHPNVQPIDAFRTQVSEFRGLPGSKGKEICVRIALNVKAPESEYKSPQGDRRPLLSGNMTANNDLISELEKLGVSQMIVAPSHDGKALVVDQVESLRKLAEHVNIGAQ